MIAALALAALLAVPGSAQATPRVVVAFVPGIAWEAPDAAVGGLVTATARSERCAADVWLTLGFGRTAALPDGCETPRVVANRVEGWDAIVRADANRHHGARPGFVEAGVGDGCVAATGPLAALAAADASGVVGEYQTSLAQSVCAVHLVDLTGEASLDSALAALRTVTAQTVVVVSLPSGTHLGGVAVLGKQGLLRGPSTRRDGLVTLTDLTELVAFNAPIPTVPGDAAEVAELDRREHLHRRYHGVFFTGLIALPMLLYIWLGFGRRRAGRTARRIGLALATYPAAGFLASVVPWWRPTLAGAAAVAAVVGAMALLLAAGHLAARLLRVPVEVGIATAVTVVFAADLLTGGYLQETGIPSYSAIAGGRFYGLGNVAFAILATAAVVSLGAAARRYGPKAWLGLLAVVLLVALPWWGADVGGAITLLPVLAVAVATRARRAALVGGTVAGVVVAGAAAALDYARPSGDRTHLGRFVAEIRNGGWTDTIARKVAAAAHSLVTWYPLLVVGSTAITASLLRRVRLADLARPLVVLWVVGSLVNDSGLAVAAAGMAVAVPLLVSYTDRP